MPLFLKKFQKLLIIFKNFLVKPNFSEVEIGSQALGLLLTAQSAFAREMGSQGSFKHCFSILTVCLTLFCRETPKYDTLALVYNRFLAPLILDPRA